MKPYFGQCWNLGGHRAYAIPAEQMRVHEL